MPESQISPRESKTDQTWRVDFPAQGESCQISSQSFIAGFLRVNTKVSGEDPLVLELVDPLWEVHHQLSKTFLSHSHCAKPATLSGCRKRLWKFAPVNSPFIYPPTLNKTKIKLCATIKQDSPTTPGTTLWSGYATLSGSSSGNSAWWWWLTLGYFITKLSPGCPQHSGQWAGDTLHHLLLRLCRKRWSHSG